MSYKIEFHSDVYEDYREAYDYYEKSKQGLGDRFIAAVRRKVDQIVETPEIFGAKSRKGYREARVEVFPYLIVYKIYKQQKAILVNSIHHEKKHPRKKYRK